MKIGDNVEIIKEWNKYNTNCDSTIGMEGIIMDSIEDAREVLLPNGETWWYLEDALKVIDNKKQDDKMDGKHAELGVVYNDDPVNHPSHYCVGNIEVIDIIENYELNYRLGNCIKYILRAGRKYNELQDLKKAQWYLNREIKIIEEKE